MGPPPPPFGTSTKIAKGLCVSHHGYNDKRPEMDAQLAKLQVTSKRIHATEVAQRLRGSMMASVLHGRCLNGAECHYIINRQTQ